MSKGDGWAVYRYKCPNCNKKGLYAFAREMGVKMHCMYCKHWCTPSQANITGTVKWKASGKSVTRKKFSIRG